ncbi:DUF1566 domain-containing protein [Candidatus Electrothrix laxa]
MRIFIFIISILFIAEGFAFSACDDFSASTPTSQFTVDSTNKTVIDTATGLMWKQCLEGDSDCSGDPLAYSFDDAASVDPPGLIATANEGSGFAGFTDWRLPNIKELQSIVEEQCSDPAINSTVFPGTPQAATVLSNSSGYEQWWTIDFTKGAMITSTSGYIRLVRDTP